MVYVWGFRNCPCTKYVHVGFIVQSIISRHFFYICYYLKSTKTAWKNVWKLLLRWICVREFKAIFPKTWNIVIQWEYISINKMLRMAYMGENGREVNPEIDGVKWVGFTKEWCIVVCWVVFSYLTTCTLPRYKKQKRKSKQWKLKTCKKLCSNSVW